MYEGQPTHTTGPRAWFFKNEDPVALKRQADQKMRELGATLNREIDFHDDCWVYTDGCSAVGLLVIDKVDEE